MASSKLIKISISELLISSLPLAKYSGCGNDFFILDDRSLFFPHQDRKLISSICRRETGGGADGLILLQNSTTADFRMRIFNADGSEAEMCGNGVRCLMKFIQTLFPLQTHCVLQTMLCNIAVRMEGESVAVSMPQPKHLSWNQQLTLDENKITFHFLDTGVPHTVVFMKNLASEKELPLGKKIRFHPHFAPQGTNVNFAEITGTQTVQVRTYERGVEAETAACGTGATATALAAAHLYGLSSPITVIPASRTPLVISFKNEGTDFADVQMTGPAKYEFTTQLRLEVVANPLKA